MPSQNIGRNSEIENFSTQGDPDDNRICKQILESDPAIRVAAFIEGAEITSFAEAARTKNAFGQSSDLRKQVGFWVSIDVRKHRVCMLHTQRVEDGKCAPIRQKVPRSLA